MNHMILKVESRRALFFASCTSPETDPGWNPISNLGNNVVYSQARKWKAAHDGLMSKLQFRPTSGFWTPYKIQEKVNLYVHDLEY